MQKQFFGVLPAVVTPVDGAGNFQAAPFARLLARLYDAQVHGLYVCGQTGEGWQQSAAQRMRVAEAAMEHSPAGKQVIVHVGAISTNKAVTLARHAAGIGATAISSLPPAGGFSFIEIKEYYRTLAEASSVPLLVYYFPSLAPAITQLDQLLELCALPNVAGLKFTDSDFFKLSSLARSGAVVFNGSDEMLAAGLLRGACGGIGSIYNLVPDLFVELYSQSAAGDWSAASRTQDHINDLIGIILRYPVLAAVKTLLAWSGLDCGPCIKPRRDLTSAESVSLREQIGASAFAGRFGSAEGRG
ncbi:MAG: dihydrodipicolinate synthase family protein [Acidobacteria bacterium]|nr:dihydrodipicolinate synthase family protein [Acidobacteriota bacterium]